jgi:hypothetical protein
VAAIAWCSRLMLAALDKFGFDITDYKIAEISKAT